MNASAVLKKGEGRTVKKGGLWIYDNEIARIEGTGCVLIGIMTPAQVVIGNDIGSHLKEIACNC